MKRVFDSVDKYPLAKKKKDSDRCTLKICKKTSKKLCEVKTIATVKCRGIGFYKNR